MRLPSRRAHILARGLSRRQGAPLKPRSFHSLPDSRPDKASESVGPATVLSKDDGDHVGDLATLLNDPTAAGSRFFRAPLLAGGVWIGDVDLVPVVIAFREKPISPQLCDTIAESAVSADARRVIGPGSEEAVLA